MIRPLVFKEIEITKSFKTYKEIRIIGSKCNFFHEKENINLIKFSSDISKIETLISK